MHKPDPYRPILEVRNLSVTFRHEGMEKDIVRAVTFSLGKAETLGIAGDSGSGKTVTALSILRLIPSPPLLKTGGRIQYQGEDLLGCSKEKMRRVRGKEIAMVFQEPGVALNPVYRIGDQIFEMIRVHEPVSKKAGRKKVIALLGELGMPKPEESVDRYPHELSGGMRQRAMMAMALSCRPRILIADEPTSALDVTIQAQILERLKKIKEERGMSVIFITHDLAVIAEMADRVLIIRNGRTVECGPVESIFHAPSHPYTKRMVDRLKERNRL